MTLVEMSIAGGVMILAVVVLRALTINRMLKKTFLALWAVVIVRLLLPFSIPSVFSIYSWIGRKAVGTGESTANVIAVPVRNMGQLVAASHPSSEAATVTATVSAWSILWFCGLLVCALFFAVAYWKCYREFQMSLPVKNEVTSRWLQAHHLRRRVSIRQSDCIASPLTFGVLHSVILMPKKTDWTNETELQYVLEHEWIHIQRFDLLFKMLLIATVCVHWFNPFVWVMYVLANRDIELSCDETVIHRFGRDARASYATVLIQMEESRSSFAPFCNHFSKNAVEERITAIMKTRKITMVSLGLAVILIAGTVTVFATSAKADGESPTPADSTKKQALEQLDRRMNLETDSADESIMSYINPSDGKTYYSFDDGKTFQAMTEEEFEQLYPTPDIEWWTYDSYKAWIEEQKVALQECIGEKGWTSGDGEFVWTQEKIDETIAMYEEILEEIKNGTMVFKSIDGQDDTDMITSYNPEDVEAGTSTTAIELEIKLDDGAEMTFGPYESNTEMLENVKPFCEEQVRLGNMTQKEADDILGRYAAEETK